MLSYITRRLLLMFPTLLGVTAVVFFIMALSPGGVGGGLARNLEGETDPVKARALREYYERRYGLNDPVILQYFRWLHQVSPVGLWTDPPQRPTHFGLAISTTADGQVRRLGFKSPDLGLAYSKGRSVTALYAEALPVTITLNLLTTPMVYGIAILTGLWAARHRGRAFDTLSGAAFLALWSIPPIWAGVMLIGYLASRDYLPLFPAGGLSSTVARDMPFLPGLDPDGRFVRGWLLDRAWHLCLPILCMTYGGFAVLSKITRGATLENLSADYVRTARAKGVDQRDVLYRHVFRNSMLPLITIAAGILPGLLVGSVIIETLFSIPGMGLLTIEAIRSRDRELVLAGTLVGGVLGLLCRLASDLAYCIADPRVSYE